MRIEYELAGLASRAGAALVDILLQGLITAAVIFGAIGLTRLFGWVFPAWIVAAMMVLIFLVFFGYHILFETIWNGQTPGKRLAGMRAVREGGLPIDLSCAAVRNLVRVVDMLPGTPPYLVGGIAVVFSSTNKRLGDMAAGTIVVKERREWEGYLRAEKPAVQPRYAETIYVKNVELVTAEEFEAVARFLDRKAELQEDVCERVALKIAEPLMQRLGIEDDGRIRYSNLLSEIHRACVEERGMC